MRCARCDNAGTHFEWEVNGRTVPIALTGGPPTSLCDECWDFYTELKELETTMLAAGCSRSEINTLLKQLVWQAAGLPAEGRPVGSA